LIPQDVAVASFEHPDIIDALTPCPTTLEKVEKRIGLAAAEMLLSLIETKAKMPLQEILIPSQLIIGESCGCSMRSQNP
jgi:DNA-binding LacI/PurR family transcriptional regulator